MKNYDAIMKMTPEQLSDFLDSVYCTGLNMGLYAARQEENDELLEENPFDMRWLAEDAEPAVLCEQCEDDEHVLNALVKAIMRNAGISSEDQDSSQHPEIG